MIGAGGSIAPNLRARILLLTVVVLLPLVGLVADMAHRNAERAFADARDQARLLAMAAAAKHDDMLLEARDVLEVVAEAHEIRTADPGACDPFLDRLHGRYGWTTGILVADKAGRILCATSASDKTVSLASWKSFQTVMATKTLVWTGYIIGQVSKKQLIGAVQPVLGEDGSVERVVVLGIDLTSFSQRLADPAIDKAGVTVTVFDRKGVVIGCYPASNGTIGWDVSANPAVREILQRRSGVIEARDHNGVNRITAFQPLEQTGATIVVAIARDPIQAGIDRQLKHDLAVLVGLVLAALLVGVLASEVFVVSPQGAGRALRAAPGLSASAVDPQGRLVAVVQLCAALAAGFGLLALVGWTADLPQLTRILPGLPTMKVLTALGLMASGGAVLLATPGGSRRGERIATILGAAVAAMAGLVLLDLVVPLGPNADLSAGTGGFARIFFDRPAPITAFALLTAGLSLALRKQANPLIESACFAARTAGFSLALFAAILYLYGPVTLKESGAFQLVALPTAISLILLFIGMELGPCGRGLARLLANSLSGGWVARRLLPATIVMPIALGWAILQFQKAGAFAAGFGFAMVALATIVAFGLALAAAGRMLNRLDADLRATVRKLETSNATLEQRVAARTAEAEQAAAEARASEAQYRLLADNATDMIILHDRAGRRSYVSPASRRLLGYEPAEALALSRTAMVHPDDFQPLQEGLAQLSRDHAEFTSVHRLRRKDGTYVWVEARIHQIPGTDDSEANFVATIRDITERRRAEEQAQRLFALLSEAIEVMDDGVAVYDSDHRLMIMNQAIQNLASDGAKRFEAGQTFEEILAVSFSDANSRDYVAWRTEKFRRADGTPDEEALPGGRWILTKDFRLRDGGVICVSSDITRLKNALAAEEAAREKSDAANQAKSAFLATMSHEIRTPMNGILGFADLLLDGSLTPDQRRYASLLRDAGKSLVTLISDILDISKIEAGRLELERLPLSPVALVDGAVSIIRSQATAKGLELRQEFAPGLPEWIASDPTRLRQILLNLLTNAVKFTESGHIGVTVRREEAGDGAKLRLEVTDTGMGIPADRLHLLFQEFSQIDRSTTRQFGGTGLGLAICKKLAAAMGGAIGVESAPGQGSTFWFTIDLVETDAPLVSQGARPHAVADAPARVLVAEDLYMNQIIVEAMLTAAGHQVTLAGNGAEAVEAVKVDEFDLILMDIEMPGMDGIEATTTIRGLGARAGDIPIIALTANAMPELARQYKAAGMNDYLSKPIDRDRLLDLVAKWSPRRPQEPASPAPEDLPVLDEALLKDLETRLGKGKVTVFAKMLREELDRAIATMTGSDDRDTIAGQAHAMVSLAGNLGCVELMTRSRNLMTALRLNAPDTPDPSAAVAEIRDAVERATAALAERYPEPLAEAV